ncbi:MAG: NHL repeat-containing protein [Candidatus Aminicenantaceae bacterium]
MKKAIAVLTVIVFIILLSSSCSKEKKREPSQWKGTIEEENGVKVVKNPVEPIYGEISLELEEDLSIGNEEDENYMFYRVSEINVNSNGNIFVLDTGNQRIQKFDRDGSYLQTIGRKGQGPGEFERPYDMFFDNQNNIFVSEGRKIQIFTHQGEFVKSFVLPIFFLDFIVNSEGNIIASGFIRAEKGQNYGVVIIDSAGKITENICEYPGISIVARKGAGFSFSHSYTPILCFSHLAGKGIIYGFSTEYKLYLIDEEGKNFLIIKKDEPFHSIDRKEKDKIVNDVIESTAREGRQWPKDVVEEGANFPQYRPFFSTIFSDDRGRIYARKLKSVLDQSKEIECDIFSQDGYYLYTTNLPFIPEIIKDGFLYDIFTPEETGEVRIKRYKISNWTDIKDTIY